MWFCWTNLASTLVGLAAINHLVQLHRIGVTKGKRSFEDIPENLLRSWSDLPGDLLISIADQFNLVDLLSFRGVCKSWRASASPATAEVESSPGRHPWFLVYRGNDAKPCLLLGNQKYHKHHFISIPELEDATCMASSHGWLLLSKQDAIFFFCPFSKAKIDLPRLPLTLSQLSDPVAAFSSPPTSNDCIICVPNRKGSRLEMYLLHRHDQYWTKHELGEKNIGSLTCGTYCNNSYFCFGGDTGRKFVTFNPRDKTGAMYRPVQYANGIREVPFAYLESYTDHCKILVKDCLGLKNDIISFSTCGTMLPADSDRQGCDADAYIANETAKTYLPDRSRLRGIWFYPRFFELPPEQQNWSL